MKRAPRILGLFFILIAAAVRGDEVQVTDESVVVFENFRILPMTGVGPLENQTIIVQGDRISYVGPPLSSTPRHARVITGEGKTILPGLADMHAHYNHREDGLLYIVNGVTTVRDPWGVGDSFAKDALAKAGSLIGPHVYMSGPTIDGPNNSFGQRDIEVSSPAEARGAVEALHAVGFQAIKIVEEIDAKSFRAAIDAARELDMQVWGHTPSSVSTFEMLDLQVDSLEHLDDYQYSMIEEPSDIDGGSFRQRAFQGWAGLTSQQLADAVDKTVKVDIWNVPTLTAYVQLPGYAADPQTFLSRSEVAYVNPSYIAAWQFLADRAADLSRPEDNSVRLRFVRLLHEAGANLLVGTDAPIEFLIPGYSIHDELANLELAGIPRADILRIATMAAAEFLGRANQFGVVKVGARADLLIVAEDPLANLEALREPQYVMMNGNLYSREDLLDELEELADRWRSLGPQPPYIGKVSSVWGNCDVSESMRCYDK